MLEALGRTHSLVFSSFQRPPPSCAHGPFSLQQWPTEWVWHPRHSDTDSPSAPLFHVRGPLGLQRAHPVVQGNLLYGWLVNNANSIDHLNFPSPFNVIYSWLLRVRTALWGTLFCLSLHPSPGFPPRGKGDLATPVQQEPTSAADWQAQGCFPFFPLSNGH